MCGRSRTTGATGETLSAIQLEQDDADQVFDFAAQAKAPIASAGAKPRAKARIRIQKLVEKFRRARLKDVARLASLATDSISPEEAGASGAPSPPERCRRDVPQARRVERILEGLDALVRIVGTHGLPTDLRQNCRYPETYPYELTVNARLPDSLNSRRRDHGLVRGGVKSGAPFHVSASRKL